MKGVPPMPTIEIDRLSPQERLDLIEKLRTSLEGVDLRVTPAQGAELERRLETLDDDIGQGQEAGDLLAELRRRYP
jgi:putative addiction module component (TIGR02574 family)